MKNFLTPTHNIKIFQHPILEISPIITTKIPEFLCLPTTITTKISLPPTKISLLSPTTTGIFQYSSYRIAIFFFLEPPCTSEFSVNNNRIFQHPTTSLDNNNHDWNIHLLHLNSLSSWSLVVWRCYLNKDTKSVIQINKLNFT